ncbi:MAG: hypothetical protein EXR69_15675 [Myxococcales bacterium]|nr:hypothetical protein [Myxococcales bacterium]
MLPLLTLTPLWAHLALAVEPTAPTVAGANTVSTAIFIAADPATVRAVLADPLRACHLSSDVLEATLVENHGECTLIQITTRGMTSPLTYTTRRCPSADGFVETLVQTDDFDYQASRWSLRPVSGGTQVTLEVRSEPRLPVPQRLINAAVGSSAVQTLKNLVQRVTSR